jgi:hypothetical protein
MENPLIIGLGIKWRHSGSKRIRMQAPLMQRSIELFPTEGVEAQQLLTYLTVIIYHPRVTLRGIS